jgi:tetratricopeptide (TPR) repeat protein
MRKLLLGILVFPVLTISAQDLQTVQRSIASNDYLSAKRQIDSVFLDKRSASDATSWYYKGRVYTEVVRQHDTSNYPMLKEAFEAYRKYQELDPKNKLMQLNNNVDLFQLYDLCFDLGMSSYTNGKYKIAYNDFRTALEAEQYISRKGFQFQGNSLPAFDTSLIYLVGSAAYLSQQTDEAIPYFERLAELKLRDKEYKGIYLVLYQNYTRKNDQAKAAKYLNLGRELFPDPDLWIRMELGNLSSEKDRFNKYEQLILKYPANSGMLTDYAVELFNYVYADTRPADFAPRQERLQALLMKALTADPNSAMANFVMSQHVYNQVYYMEEALREMKDETTVDQNKKKAFATKLDAKYDELLLYSQKAYNLYIESSTPENRENCRKVVNQLISYYQKKKQTEKVNFYLDKLKNL